MKIKSLNVAAMIVALSFAGIVIGQTEVEKTEARVSQIITRAEDHFRKGKLNLDDNKREAARDEFDKAVDTILESGLNVRESQRLQTFYLELIERIYREELPLRKTAQNSKPTQPVSQIGSQQQEFNSSPPDELSKLVLTPDVKPRASDGQRKQSVKHVPKEEARVTAQMAQLREDFIKATKDYKASLAKLIAFYEADVPRAETRFAMAKELFAQGLVAKRELDESERAIATAKAKIIETREQIVTADAQIAQMPTTAELVREQLAWERKHRQASARQPSCRNWTLTASRHQRGRTVTVAFKLVWKD